MASPLREILAQFGFDFDKAASEQATKSIAGVMGAVRSLGAMLIGGAVVHGIASFAQSMIDTGGELNDLRQQLGVSATELVEWRHAARMAGVEASEMDGALRRTALAAARNSPLFRQFHVSTRDAGGQMRRTTDIFEDAAVALGAIDNDTRRAALAQQLFGQSGTALVPLFRAGRDGIRDLRAEVRRLYGTDLEQLADQSSAAGDAQNRLSMTLDAMRTRLAVFLLPALTEGLETILGWATAVAEAVRSSNILEATLGVLGAAAVAAALMTIGAWGPPLALFALIAAGVAAIVLIVEDLITMFRGGRSVIGSFIDEIWGVGTAQEVVRRLKQAWQDLVGTVTDAYNAVRRFLGLGDGTTTASGDQRAATRGLGKETVGAEEDFRRSLGHRAPTLSTHDQFAEHVGRRARLIRDFGPEFGGQQFIRAPRPTSVTSTRTTTVGAIHVSGAGDPTEVARRTRDAIEEASADDQDHAGADLVPATGGA